MPGGSRPLPPRHPPRAWHALDAVDEVGAEVLGRAGDLEVGDAARDLAEHHAHLAAREVRSEAVVRAGAAEADVLVRRARDVEAIGVAEDVLVAVRRVVPEHDLLAGADLLAGQLGVARGGPPEVDDRARPADELLERSRRDALEVGPPLP